MAGAERDVEAVIRKISHHTGVRELKKEQIVVISWCMQSDVLAILPTGFGKTLIIEALPFIHQHGLVVVVNPLTAIIQEQKERFKKAAVVLDQVLLEDQAALEKLGNEAVHYILGHPEDLTDTRAKALFMSLSSKITHIVVDEAHCVLSWGMSDFRPSFLEIQNLRCMVPSARILALTATAAPKAQQEIFQALAMVDPKVVSVSPDRPNVFLRVTSRLPSTGATHSVEDSYECALDPFLEELEAKGAGFPKTIVYLPLRWCGHTHHHALKDFFKDHPMAAVSEEAIPLLAQYHAPQTREMKSMITNAMQDPDGNLRLLFATEAYGMGADPPDVRRVVHVGPPTSIETYIQEIGRSGRDGLSSSATMYVNATDLSPSRCHVQEEMRQYCRLDSCRREYLMSYFGFPRPELDPHLCCDNCQKACMCETCQLSHRLEESTKQPVVDVAAKALLERYFSGENGLVSSPVPSLITGLSAEFASVLSSNIPKFCSREAILAVFPDIKEHYICNIIKILQSYQTKKSGQC